MERYGLSILGVSEARWNGTGKRKLSNGKLMLYSGKDEGEVHQAGVALLLSRQARDSLIDWEGHGDRIIRATFRSTRQRLHMDIILVYAPTNGADEETYCDLYLSGAVEFNKEIGITMITGKTHRRRNLRCSPGAMRGCQSGLPAQIRLGGRLDQWFASSEVYRRNHEMQPVLKLYNNQGPTTARLLGRLINANITTYPRASLYGQRNSNQCDKRKIK